MCILATTRKHKHEDIERVQMITATSVNTISLLVTIVTQCLAQSNDSVTVFCCVI